MGLATQLHLTLVQRESHPKKQTKKEVHHHRASDAQDLNIRRRGRRTWRSAGVVFGAVMSDAAMLDPVLELDVWGKERVEGERRG